MVQDPTDRPAGERRRAARTASWVVLVVVVLIGAIATGVAWVQEGRSARAREQTALTAVTAGVDDATSTAAAALGGGAALVDDDGRIATSRLATFAEDVAAVSSLEAVGLIEVVPAEQRPALEARLGRPVFGIDDVGVVPAEAGPQNWVVTRVVPEDDLTSTLLGFDVLSNPISRGAAVTAGATGEATVTPAVVLPADIARQLGSDGELTVVFVLRPLYAPPAVAATPGDETDATLVGFLVSAVTGPQLAGSIAPDVPEGVEFRVLDGDTVLAGSAGPVGGAGREVDALGRTWRVEVDDGRRVGHSFSLLVGVVTVLLLAILTVVMLRERRRQQHLRRVGAAVRGTADLARRLSAAAGVGEVVGIIEGGVAPLVGAVGAAVMVVDSERGVLGAHPDTTVATLTPQWPLDAGAVVEAGAGDVVMVRSLQRPSDQVPEGVAAALLADGVRSLALLPITTVGPDIDAVVVVVWSATAPDDALASSTLATLDEMCEQALARSSSADRNSRQAGALAALAEELARCDTVAQVSDAVLKVGRQPVQAAAISIGLIDDDARVLRIRHGDTVADQVSRRYGAPPLDTPLAFTDAARTGEPVLVERFADYREQYPSTDPSHALLGEGARAALPLVVGGLPIGAIAFAWDRDRRFDDATMFSLTTIAELAAQAVHRARLMAMHRIDAVRSRELATVAQQLAVLADGGPLARFVVDRSVGVIGADAAILVVNDASDWRDTATAGLQAHPELLARLVGQGHGRPGAIAAAVERGHDRPTGLGDGADGSPGAGGGHGTGELGAELAAAGFATSSTLALRDRDGQPLGGLWLAWRQPVRMDDDLRDVVDTLVGMTAQSVARCLLTDQLRADAERNERLATFARRLANVSDVDQLYQVVIDDGGGTVGAAVADLGLLDDTAERLVVSPDGQVRPALHPAVRERAMTDAHPGVDAARTGEPVLLRSPEEIEQHYPGHVARTMASAGLLASAHLPLLTADGTVIGSVGFAWTYRQAFRPAKLARLRTIAELCTQTVERARLADAEHRLVESIHRRVVGRTPSVDELAIATRYLPATEEIGMGGDWYDAVVLDPTRYAVIVGDVTGHGISAVADMIELRAAIRSLLQHGVALELVFSQVSSSWSDSTESLATACISVVDTATGTLDHVSAGHIPALVRSPDGVVRPIEGGRQPLLGVPGRVSRPDTVPFPRGSTLIMCSDGLIERRDRSIDESIDSLAAVLRGAATELGDVEALADLVLGRCLTFSSHEDDVALVVVQHLGAAAASDAGDAGDTGRERSFEALPSSVGAARRFVAETVPGAVDDDLALVTSELVTNAVLHGRGPLTVRVQHRDGRVRVAVHDHGHGRPRADRPALHSEGGRGLGIVDTVSDRWGVEPQESGKWVWAELDDRRH